MPSLDLTGPHLSPAASHCGTLPCVCSPIPSSLRLALPFAPPASSPVPLQALGERFGYPMMLKTRKDAYDGKGNAVPHPASTLMSQA